MKKKLGIAPLLFFVIPIFAATVRVYNKIGNNKKITVTTITPKKRMVEPIESMRSHFFNTWFEGIEGFEWEVNGYKYAAPLKMRALQTEGRLYIKSDGKYSFKPCLPCKESQGDAQVVKSPTPKAPPAPSNGKKSNIPTPPPLPPATKKLQTIPAPPAPQMPKNGKRARPQDLLEDIQKGKKLRKVEPTQKPVSSEAQFLHDIKQGKQLKSSSDRTLAPKPDTRTSRDKLLGDIQKGINLRKTAGPEKKTHKHEMIDPLSKAIDERRKQLRQIEESTDEDGDSWADEEAEYSEGIAAPAA